MSNAHVRAYQTSTLQHATGAELVAACFREARKSLGDARRFVESGTPASSYTPLERARKIYTHLYATVDTEAGGELAEQMQQLYVWMIDQTIELVSSFNLDQLASLEQITTDQLEAWVAISARETQAVSPPPVSIEPQVRAGA